MPYDQYSRAVTYRPQSWLAHSPSASRSAIALRTQAFSEGGTPPWMRRALSACTSTIPAISAFERPCLNNFRARTRRACANCGRDKEGTCGPDTMLDCHGGAHADG
ncbi:hypothetical protein GCM10010226_80270 [Streptomyces phaeofaciens]|uniref:Uncharacterized protein n=1 Tax=Streptomyces phaeofaciens TaxID=68254 RepID=A0A918HP68_9ACTN|nr:hypothetical protein GCM10010226_80270 [Streptomyces phaeofaciens]